MNLPVLVVPLGQMIGDDHYCLESVEEVLSAPAGSLNSPAARMNRLLNDDPRMRDALLVRVYVSLRRLTTSYIPVIIYK